MHIVNNNHHDTGIMCLYVNVTGIMCLYVMCLYVNVNRYYVSVYVNVQIIMILAAWKKTIHDLKYIAVQGIAISNFKQ